MSSCPRCGSNRTRKAGFSDQGKSKRYCNNCKRSYVEGGRHYDWWSPEEDDLLIMLAQAPYLERTYNRYAKAYGWAARTRTSLEVRLSDLKESRRDSSEWVVQSQLMSALGLAPSNCKTPSIWRASGLKAYQDGSVWRIHLGDFARWALTPIGQELVAKAVTNNQSAVEWLLWCIAEYRSVPNPIRQIPKKAS